MIWVIGGTSEAREFINLFENREILVVTVAMEEKYSWEETYLQEDLTMGGWFNSLE